MAAPDFPYFVERGKYARTTPLQFWPAERYTETVPSATLFFAN
jgi:hypothetical protein